MGKGMYFWSGFTKSLAPGISAVAEGITSRKERQRKEEEERKKKEEEQAKLKAEADTKASKEALESSQKEWEANYAIGQEQKQADAKAADEARKAGEYSTGVQMGLRGAPIKTPPSAEFPSLIGGALSQRVPETPISEKFVSGYSAGRTNTPKPEEPPAEVPKGYVAETIRTGEGGTTITYKKEEEKKGQDEDAEFHGRH